MPVVAAPTISTSHFPITQSHALSGYFNSYNFPVFKLIFGGDDTLQKCIDRGSPLRLRGEFYDAGEIVFV